MNKKILTCLILLALVAAWPGPPIPVASQGVDNPNPPAQPVKLIFIHHSTGGNWLADPSGNELGGGLGSALMENNYFVSATNYGWGPDGIGDRTDIINWPEWFTGPNRDTILAALYTETGQNYGDGEWPRLAEDPGGENQIILFKSCFPNSNMGGSPNDPPAAAPNEDLTVANAKAVYNDLLAYFATRPDKLFIVITAPPLAKSDTDPASAANARAFNNWLMNEWLNGYTIPNVAVFDFYNVLTSGPGPSRNDAGQATGNHHRWWDGAVQHTQSVDNNFLVYPSGDSHPSRAGNEKATAEFIPLLNVYYNRWKAGTPVEPSEQPTATQAAAEALPTETPPTEAPVEGVTQPLALIDDFESVLAETDGWQPFWDEATATTIRCAPNSSAAHRGNQSLNIDFDVTANSWATCALSFGQPRDWSTWQGVSFYLHASQPALVFNVDIYKNTPQGTETYEVAIETPPESVDGWVPFTISWEQLTRVAWETNGGTPLNDPAQVDGLAFGFSTYPDTNNTGVIWIDELELTNEMQEIPAKAPTPESTETPSGPAATTQVAPAETEAAPVATAQIEPSPTALKLPEPTQTQPPQPTEAKTKPRNRVCASAFIAPLAIVSLAVWTRNKRRTVAGHAEKN